MNVGASRSGMGGTFGARKPTMNELEQLAQHIFKIAMDDYDLKIRTAEDPEERAMLAYHRGTAESVARDYSLREAHKLLCNSVPMVVH